MKAKELQTIKDLAMIVRHICLCEGSELDYKDEHGEMLFRLLEFLETSDTDTPIERICEFTKCKGTHFWRPACGGITNVCGKYCPRCGGKIKEITNDSPRTDN